MPTTALLPDEAVEAIRARKRFDAHWTIGRVTRGGTYIISSKGNTTDSGNPRDLVAVLPGDLGHGRVLALTILVNPEFVSFLEAALAEDGGGAHG